MITKSEIIEHPLRTIHLGYNQQRPLNEGETHVIKTYVAAHDTLFAFGERYDQLNGLLMKLETTLAQLLEELTACEHAMRTCGPLAGISSDELAAHGIESGEVNVTSVIDAVLEFNDHLHEHYKGVVEFDGGMQAWIADVEKFDEEYDSYSQNHLHKIFVNWETTEIDVLVLDDDTQAFLDYWSEVSDKKHGMLIDNWNAYNEQFTACSNRATILYKRLEVLDKTVCDMMDNGSSFSLN